MVTHTSSPGGQNCSSWYASIPVVSEVLVVYKLNCGLVWRRSTCSFKTMLGTLVDTELRNCDLCQYGGPEVGIGINYHM